MRSTLRVAARFALRTLRVAAVGAKTAASRRHQDAQFGLVCLGEGFGEQMRKTVRRPLHEAREHFGIQIPELGLVLRAEDAALGAALEALFQLLGIDSPEKLLERGASGAQGRGVLSLELTEVLADRLDGARPGRGGGKQADQCFIDAARKIQR